MKIRMLLVGTCAALAACNSSPTVTATNASGEEVAEKIKASGINEQFVSPGHWRTTMAIAEMNIPGTPPELAEQMKSHMGKGRSFETCLTPENAKKPKEDFFAKGNGNCRYDSFKMGGGTIDAVMQCKMGEGTRKMTMNGTYGANAYRMTVASSGTGDASNPMAGMSMKMVMDAKRTGECTGKEKG